MLEVSKIKKAEMSGEIKLKKELKRYGIPSNSGYKDRVAKFLEENKNG